MFKVSIAKPLSRNHVNKLSSSTSFSLFQSFSIEKESNENFQILSIMNFSSDSSKIIIKNEDINK